MDAGKSSDAGIECQSRLAFQSYRDGNSEIYVSDADGSNQTNLTRNPTTDVAPRWSPDGARITFVRDSQVWIMNADGSDPTQLTTGSNDSEPQWSPDGTHIALIRNDSGAFNLWVVSDSGDEPAQLTTAGASRFSWSPDGTKLAFSTDRNGNADIYTMNSDGSAEAIRAGDSADNDRPTWSPDGFEILFQSRRSGNDDLWIVGPLGNDPRNLTNSPHSERSAAFVPDGSKIIYQRGLNPAIQHNLGVFESDLYRMNADGSEQQQLTFEEGEDATPSVSSDGRRIAWTRNVGPTIDVYVANADGTKSVPLTTTGVDIAPVWQPCP